jgi:hypothetical protein
MFILCANVAELVDALDLGSSGVACESSSLSIRTINYSNKKQPIQADFPVPKPQDGALKYVFQNNLR